MALFRTNFNHSIVLKIKSDSESSTFGVRLLIVPEVELLESVLFSRCKNRLDRHAPFEHRVRAVHTDADGVENVAA